MKQSYAIGPEKYSKNIDTMNEIEYNTGYTHKDAKKVNPFTGKTKAESTPKNLVTKYEKAYAENKQFEKQLPKGEEREEFLESAFCENDTMFNLWLNRNTDEPITARELYQVVKVLLGEVDDAETRASLSGWDGR